jgi:hypothetical protein
MEDEQKTRQTLQYLRIAFSALCGILCLVLIALWVRSYSVRDQTRGCIAGSRHHIYITSLNGQIAIGLDEWRGTPHDWIFESRSEPENLVTVFPTVNGTPPLSWVGFRWQIRANLWVIVLPVWSLFALLVGSSFLPWLRCRFSLRTLLTVTTVVAAILGIIAASN